MNDLGKALKAYFERLENTDIDPKYLIVVASLAIVALDADELRNKSDELIESLQQLKRDLEL